MSAGSRGERWQEHAACIGKTATFYPERAGFKVDYEPALRICAVCPVRVQCLHHAIEAREEYGVWGGLTPDQLFELKRALRRWVAV